MTLALQTMSSVKSLIGQKKRGVPAKACAYHCKAAYNSRASVTYPGSSSPALQDLSFDVPSGRLWE